MDNLRVRICTLITATALLAGCGGGSSTDPEPVDDPTGTPTPELPVGPTPETPVDPAPETPENPGSEAPSDPGAETPEDPAPEEPAPEAPENPEPEAPVDPEPEAPENPVPEAPQEPEPEPDPELPPGAGLNPNTGDIEPDRSVHTADGYATADVIRVDLRTETTKGTCAPEDLSGCTLEDVINDTDKRDDLTVDIAVHFKSDDFADDGTVSNAELRQRGGGARFAPQKSFRIKLDSKDVLWRNERHLQLNKHPFDKSRIRNMLAFKLMSQVPHLPSLRTQFVNLWIDDGEGPVDYGLFTHVEKVNNRYLRKRGINDEGNIYKAEDFRFAYSDLLDVAVDANGEPLDKNRFESSIEIEEGKDHRALEKMLSALHDPNRSFQSVLDEHFNWNNVMAWMTVNILFHQADATRHNYMLYNPVDTEKFYFIPWDYDLAMTNWPEPANDYSPEALMLRIDYGYAVGTQNYFTNQFYRLPGIHEKLIDSAQFLRQNYLTDSLIAEMVNSYVPLVEPLQTREPDATHNSNFKVSSVLKHIESLAFNEEALRTKFKIPMPPSLFEPERVDSRWRFSWIPAFEVTGNSVTYDLEISRSINFEADSIITAVTGIEDSRDEVEQFIDSALLSNGEHFVRLTARASNDPGRYWQVADNRIERNGTRYYGVRQFDVP